MGLTVVLLSSIVRSVCLIAWSSAIAFGFECVDMFFCAVRGRD